MHACTVCLHASAHARTLYRLCPQLRGREGRKLALEAAKRRAARAALRPIWQPGNHEAFLLSHFPTAARPKSVEAAWPGYAKGQDAIFYERKLTLELLAAARKENAGFDEFLNVCGLLPHAAGA